MEVSFGRKVDFFATFSFFFFLPAACTGRAPTTGEKTYAFSAGKPKTGRYLFAEQRFPWACLREPLLREQILHKGSVVCVPLCFFFFSNVMAPFRKGLQ